MSIDQIKAAMPAYAKDIKLNVSSILGKQLPGLSEAQQFGIAVACAMACRNKLVRDAIMAEAAEKLDDVTLNAAKMSAALMSMNNVYYRFMHLVEDAEYSKMPAGLRMNGMMNPGIDKVSFELMSIAVSAINGCGMCMGSHNKVLLDAGASREQIQNAVRMASIIHAAAVVADEEEFASVEQGAEAAA